MVHSHSVHRQKGRVKDQGGSENPGYGDGHTAVDSVGEEEIRALDDPDFAGISLWPIRPRVKTAPVIERP